MRVAAGFAALLVLAFAAPSTAAPDETTQFRVGPAKDNQVHGSTLRPPLKARWEVRIGNTRSNVIVAGGRVFFVNHDNVKAEVTALDAATGTVLWAKPAGPGTRGWGLAYEGGRLVVARLDWGFGDDGRIWTLDAATGNGPLWEKKLTESYGISAHPSVADGVVYVPASDGGNYLYALSLATGEQLWKSGFMHSGGRSSPSLDATSVYMSLGGGQTYARARDTGAERWHYQTCCTGGGGTTVVINGGKLFNQEAGNVVQDAATGRVIGSYPGYSGEGAIPAFAGDMGLFTPHPLVALDASGNELWRYTPFDPYDYAAWPLVAGGHAYVMEDSQFITAIELTTGQPVWCGAFVPPPGSTDTAIATPSIGHGMLIVPIGYALVALEGGGSGSGCPNRTGGPGSDPASGGGQSGGARAAGPTLKAIPEDTRVGRRVTLAGIAAPGQRVSIESDAFPYRTYKTLVRVTAAADGAFTARFTPRRNTRLRALAGGQASDPVTVYAEHPSSIRRRGRTVHVTVVAPARAAVARRRVFFYVGAAKAWRRVAARRFTRRGARLVASATYPRLSRRTRVLVCVREKSDDGYGRPNPLDPLCGRRTLPRTGSAAVAARVRPR